MFIVNFLFVRIFLTNNITLNVANNDGDVQVYYTYKYHDYEYETSLYYYYSSESSKSSIKTKDKMPLSSVALWGEIPETLKENEIIIHYDQISYMIDSNSNINDFMKDFNATEMTFMKYDNNGMIARDISKDIKVVAVIEDNESFHSYGLSPAYPVPNDLVEEIKSKDLAQVINRVFEVDSTRPHTQGGVALLTGGITTRVDLTRDATIMALIPLNCDKWHLS